MSGLGILLLISPLLQASWDIWSKTVIHLLTAGILLSYIFRKSTTRCVLPIKYHLAIAALLVWLIVSVYFSKVAFSSKQELFNWLNYIAVFYIASTTLPNKIGYYIATSILIQVCISLGQIFTGKVIRGTMLNPNILAGYFITAVPFLLHLCAVMGTNVPYDRSQKILFRIVVPIVVILSSFILLLMKSYGAIISIFVVSLFCIRKKFSPALSLLLLIFIALFVYYKTYDPELLNRYFWWKDTVYIIIKHPFLGTGLGTFEHLYTKYKSLPGLSSLYAHNYYLQIAAEIGLVGLILFCIIIILILLPLPDFFLSLSLLSCLFVNVFDYNMYIPANSILLWAVLGVAVHKRHSQQQILSVTTRKKIIMALCYKICLCGVILFFVYNIFRSYLAVLCFNHGEKYFHEGRFVLAEGELMEAIRLDHNLWHPYGFLADIYLFYYKQTGDKVYLSKAEKQLLLALAQQPYSSEYYFQLSKIYKQSQQKNKMWYHAKMAIECNPTKAVMYINLLK